MPKFQAQLNSSEEVFLTFGDPLLDKTSAALMAANTSLTIAVNAAIQAAAERAECQRQVNYHLGNGDQQNANIASATCLAPANIKADAAEAKKLAAIQAVKTAEAAYKQAYADYEKTQALKNIPVASTTVAQNAAILANTAGVKITAGASSKTNWVLYTSIGVAVIILGTAVKLIFFNKKSNK